MCQSCVLTILGSIMFYHVLSDHPKHGCLILFTCHSPHHSNTGGAFWLPMFALRMRCTHGSRAMGKNPSFLNDDRIIMVWLWYQKCVTVANYWLILKEVVQQPMVCKYRRDIWRYPVQPFWVPAGVPSSSTVEVIFGRPWNQRSPKANKVSSLAQGCCRKKTWMPWPNRGLERIHCSVSKPCTPAVHIKIAGIYGCSSP